MRNRCCDGVTVAGQSVVLTLSFFSSVPLKVSSVSDPERSTTSVNLTWGNVNPNWGYVLHIDGRTIQVEPNENQLHSLKIDLKPGTEYPFSLITTFSGLNSTEYKSFTVTRMYTLSVKFLCIFLYQMKLYLQRTCNSWLCKTQVIEALTAVILSFISEINCTTVNWRVTNSSIQGMVEGIFSNATASNKVTHVSLGGSNVSFTGLTPGTTYEVLLWYEKEDKNYTQCEHSLTISKYKPVSLH